MLALAVASLVGWFGLLAVLARRSRPGAAEPAAPSLDLPGDESPALVNLVTNGFRPTRDAVAATLLDLAARGFVSIQHLGTGKFVVRVEEGPGQADPLRDYERMVLDLVRSLAGRTGNVPGEALTIGSADRAEKWWRRFRKLVVAEARGRRLSRPRWRSGLLAVLVVLACVPAYLTAGALVDLVPDEPELEDLRDRLQMAAWLLPVLLSPLLLMRRETDTAEGRRVAGRWLGLRRYLAEDEAFCDQPPGGVAIWERYLAFGAAMGVARGAVRELPMGSESPTEAWSPYAGQWRIVRVNYPKWVPPGWGMKPWHAVWSGAVGLIPIGFMLFVVAPIVLPIFAEFLGGGGIAELVVILFFTPFLFMLFVGMRMLGTLVLGLADLRADRREVLGLVVRMQEVYVRRDDKRVSYQTYVAVDDGRQPEVDAWLIPNGYLVGVAPGTVVKAWVTPRLGHVERLVPVDPARP